MADFFHLVEEKENEKIENKKGAENQKNPKRNIPGQGKALFSSNANIKSS